MHVAPFCCVAATVRNDLLQLECVGAHQSFWVFGSCGAPCAGLFLVFNVRNLSVPFIFRLQYSPAPGQLRATGSTIE